MVQIFTYTPVYTDFRSFCDRRGAIPWEFGEKADFLSKVVGGPSWLLREKHRTRGFAVVGRRGVRGFAVRGHACGLDLGGGLGNQPGVSPRALRLLGEEGSGVLR
jgi:hypothetical protein